MPNIPGFVDMSNTGQKQSEAVLTQSCLSSSISFSSLPSSFLVFFLFPAPSLSFHLRSNNVSNPYSQPAFPPTAISATALENSIPAIWLSDSKYICESSVVCVHNIILLFLCDSFVCLLLVYRWTDQSRWSQQTARVEEVCLFPFPSPPIPSSLPLSFCHCFKPELPAQISFTIICPIRAWPVCRRRLTVRPGPTPPLFKTHYVNTALTCHCFSYVVEPYANMYVALKQD